MWWEVNWDSGDKGGEGWDGDTGGERRNDKDEGIIIEDCEDRAEELSGALKDLNMLRHCCTIVNDFRIISGDGMEGLEQCVGVGGDSIIEDWGRKLFEKTFGAI